MDSLELCLFNKHTASHGVKGTVIQILYNIPETSTLKKNVI